jgi:hypothetical protein
MNLDYEETLARSKSTDKNNKENEANHSTLSTAQTSSDYSITQDWINRIQ